MNHLITKVKGLYPEWGYEVGEYYIPNVGNARCLIKDGVRLGTGLGLLDGDIRLFLELANQINPSNIFVIGNAFGFSTFLLNCIYSPVLIDAIDAECEGAHNRLGSQVTRDIINKHNYNIKLITGFSPFDVNHNNLRSQSYDLVFVDGLHTNEQMFMDFYAILPYLAETCCVVFHDITLFKLERSLEKLFHDAKAFGFTDFCAKHPSSEVGTSYMLRMYRSN